jgi:hypothetical protein
VADPVSTYLTPNQRETLAAMTRDWAALEVVQRRVNQARGQRCPATGNSISKTLWALERRDLITAAREQPAGRMRWRLR